MLHQPVCLFIYSLENFLPHISYQRKVREMGVTWHRQLHRNMSVIKMSGSDKAISLEYCYISQAVKYKERHEF